MSFRRLLARCERNHPDSVGAESLEELDRLVARVATAAGVDDLRGFEGARSGAYFRQFGKMLSNVGFPSWKRRPATDPANSLLRLGHVMVGNELGSLLEARGFDPAIGFLHGVRYGRSSLALDVVEVFRQPVVDRLTLRLLNRGQIKPEEFEGGEGASLAAGSARAVLRALRGATSLAPRGGGLAVETSELWPFVGMKERTKERLGLGDPRMGDAYAFLAMARKSKLVLAGHLIRTTGSTPGWWPSWPVSSSGCAGDGAFPMTSTSDSGSAGGCRISRPLRAYALASRRGPGRAALSSWVGSRRSGPTRRRSTGRSTWSPASGSRCSIPRWKGGW